ncbi:DUF1349 domain-containing protein [Desulfuromonas sp. AOP6]|uniref:DUF1349 domain-containing protein n=1 Tax=Desulfuromonas sp. AOP6 TaxID=1566351 RepID=UPI00127C274C|nr:DUF1349 domain-containing protein [Desulfuromonas sp. AOP6]BCA79489.1 hypothetical protein AOP6_1276 [Desulfuromonas sp. AOP6]
MKKRHVTQLGQRFAVTLSAFWRRPVFLLILFLVLVQSAPAWSLVSDDFNASSLNGNLWQLVDPIGDATVSLSGAGTTDARLQFSVPAGLSHDAWTANSAPHLLQTVANTDFVIEVKFDSPVAKKYQGQGVLVKQDTNSWLRFDFYSNGSGTRIFAAAKTISGMSVKVDKAITSGAPLYMRVARNLNTWTQSYSYDGINWTTAITFSHTLTVAAVGPFVGNFATSGDAPAHTALVDYVFNVASPIVPEDGGAEPTLYFLDVMVIGGGQVSLDPPDGNYASGTQVELMASADAGWYFSGWSGDLTGLVNPASLVMDNNLFVQANFLADTSPPIIGPVSVVAGSNNAVLSWETSEPTTCRIDYGHTADYGLTQDLAQSDTTHQLTLSGLSSSSTYHYKVTAVDGAGLSANSGDQVFTTSEIVEDPLGLVSDDFSQPLLNALWRLYDPLGDATVALVGSGSADARLSFSVPAGPSHDPWVVDTAPRLLQDVNNTDFIVELKFDSPVTSKYQGQGLMVQQDDNTWLRFDFFSDGSKTLIFAASKTNGKMSTKINKGITLTDAPMYLRVTRSGDLWTEDYSQDGINWVTAGSFSHSLTVTSMGPFAGNFATSGDAPAHTALVDYVFSAASPIVPEDGDAEPTLYPLDIKVVGGGQVSLNPPDGSYVSGTQVELTASADSGWYFYGWGGALTGNANPTTLVMDGAKAVDAIFQAQTQPPQISAIEVNPGETEATISWVTDSPASSTLEYGETSELGASVSDLSLVTNHSLHLTGLTSGMQYFYRVISANMAGETQSSVQTFTTLLPGADPSGIISDDFNQPNLNPSLWILVDPLQDATVAIEGSGSGSAQLLFSIPAGASHDPWTVNTAPRLLQTANDTDFELEAKFESQPQLRYQGQGLFIEQDTDNWLRFDIYHDGTATRIFAASCSAGTMSTRINKVIAAGSPLYLRVTRAGSQWTESYSYDGITWLTAGSFSHVLTVQAVGPFVNNYSTTNSAPAYTAIIDYFFNRAAPVVPEDGDTIVDSLPPLIQQLGYTVSPNGFEVSWFTDEPATGQVEYGLTSSLEMDSLGHFDLTTAHSVQVSGLQAETNYYFRASSSDGSGNQSSSAIQSLQTPASSGWAPVIDVWYGDEQTFGQVGTPQPMVNILGSVTGTTDIVSLTYSLNGGAELPLTVGPDGLRLVGEGDFNIELAISSLQLGANTVQIRAVDSAGYQSQRQVQVNLVGANEWPLPYAIDWTQVSDIENVAQVVDGRWMVQADGVRTTQVGYDRLIAIGDLAWQNYEVTVPITVHSTQYVGSNPPAVGLIVRWIGHTPDGKQPAERWWPLGVFGMYRWYLTNPGLRLYDFSYQIVDPTGLQLPLGVPHVFKLRARTLPGPVTEYKFKVWPASQSEPEDWTLVYQEGSGDTQAGSFLLVAHFVDVTFGNVTVVPVFD